MTMRVSADYSFKIRHILIISLFKVEKPPTVLFRHQNGPIAQSNDGKLIVYPGTTIHMECLWMRRFGNPKWNVSHDYRYVNSSIHLQSASFIGSESF